MKLCRIFFTVVIVCIFNGNLFAQNTKVVLFETFANSCDGCTLNDDFDAAFRQTLAANGTKIVHLNHHVINTCDPMTANDPASLTVLSKLSNIYQQPYPISCADVDRTNFPAIAPNSAGKLTGTVPGGKTQWDTRIASELKLSTPVAISLASAKIDTISSSTVSRFIATINVTSAQTNDTMAIHYAITQDNIYFAQCPTAKPPGPTTHNDVVRYVTTTDSTLNFKSQTQNTVTFIQNIAKINTATTTFDLSQMKFIAWVEDHSGGDYTVSQAALLQTNLQSLSAPAPSLSLNTGILDNAVFAPGDLVTILFDKVSVDSVKIEFSSDGGTSWQTIGTTHDFKMYWTAPTLSTTQGKIRISELKSGTPIVTETGTFTIKSSDYSLSLLKPDGNTIAYIGQKFTVTWNQHGFDTLYIEYSSDNGNHWQTLNIHRDPTGTANSYNWSVAGPATAQAMMRLRPFAADKQTSTSLSDPFQVLNTTGDGVNSTPDESFSISVNPQPLKRSEQLKLNLKLGNYSGVDISMYDLNGKKVYSKDRMSIGAGDNTISLELNALPAGTYILAVQRDNGEVRTVKVVIE